MGFFIAALAPAATPPPVLIYPAPTPDQAYSAIYPQALLALAFSKRDARYQLVPGKAGVSQSRAMKLLEEGRGIDVIWTMTSTEREALLRPIRIPIYKGLFGWRIPLVQAQNREAFAALEPGQLKNRRAGQVHDWPDTRILRHNGYQVASSASYSGLFKMLANNRIDYFPRSVLEIWQEIEAHPEMGIVADGSVLLCYRSAIYFFVGKHNPTLGDTIRDGLELAVADGSFEKLFMAHHGAHIRRAGLEARRVYELDNPLLPPTAPLERRELWFSVAR